MLKLINDYLPTILVVLLLISSYYNFLKTNDPKLADKVKAVGEFANWAVALQNTYKDNISNELKQQQAVNDVLEQSKKAGLKITRATALGAVEKAVKEQKQTPAQTVATPVTDVQAPAPEVDKLC